MRPYLKIFVASLAISAVLVGIDYRYNASMHASKQVMADIFLWGAVNTIVVFALASLLYYACRLLRRVFGKRFANKESQRG